MISVLLDTTSILLLGVLFQTLKPQIYAGHKIAKKDSKGPNRTKMDPKGPKRTQKDINNPKAQQKVKI